MSISRQNHGHCVLVLAVICGLCIGSAYGQAKSPGSPTGTAASKTNKTAAASPSGGQVSLDYEYVDIPSLPIGKGQNPSPTPGAKGAPTPAKVPAGSAPLRQEGLFFPLYGEAMQRPPPGAIPMGEGPPMGGKWGPPVGAFPGGQPPMGVPGMPPMGGPGIPPMGGPGQLPQGGPGGPYMGGEMGEQYEWLRERVRKLRRYGATEQLKALQKQFPKVNLTMMYNNYGYGGYGEEGGEMGEGGYYYYNGTYYRRPGGEMEDGYYYNGTFYPGEMEGPEMEDGYYYNGTWYPGEREYGEGFYYNGTWYPEMGDGYFYNGTWYPEMEDGYYYNGTYYPGEMEGPEMEDGYFYNGTYYPGYEQEGYEQEGYEQEGYEQEGYEQEDLMWWQLHHPRWKNGGMNSVNNQKPQLQMPPIQQQPYPQPPMKPWGGFVPPYAQRPPPQQLPPPFRPLAPTAPRRAPAAKPKPAAPEKIPSLPQRQAMTQQRPPQPQSPRKPVPPGTQQRPPPSATQNGSPTTLTQNGPPPSRTPNGAPPSRTQNGAPPSRTQNGPPPSRTQNGPPPSRTQNGAPPQQRRRYPPVRRPPGDPRSRGPANGRIENIPMQAKMTGGAPPRNRPFGSPGERTRMFQPGMKPPPGSPGNPIAAGPNGNNVGGIAGGAKNIAAVAGTPGNQAQTGTNVVVKKASPLDPYRMSTTATWGIVIASLIGVTLILAPLACILYKYRQEKRIKKRTFLKRPEHGSVDDGIMDAMIMSDLGERKGSRITKISSGGASGWKKPEKYRAPGPSRGSAPTSLWGARSELRSDSRVPHTIIGMNDDPDIRVT